MSGSTLDELPAWSWFLWLDLHSAALVIATIGILHPTAYIYSCIVHRGLVFLVLWTLSALWSAFSVGLLAGILQKLELAYECWEWFTLVLAPLMIVLMVMVAVNCICIDEEASVAEILVPVLAVVFYCITVYLVFVVNSYRLEAFPKSL